MTLLRRKLLYTLVFLLLISLITVIYRNQPQPMTVKTSKVTKGDISLMVFTSGRVDLTDKQDIRAGGVGSVNTVNVKIGDQVKVGQSICSVTLLTGSVPQTISITTPIAGTVLATNVFKGDSFTTETTLFTIGKLDTLFIKGNVNETDLLQVNSGQNVKITGDAFPNKTYHGVVQEVSLTPSNNTNITIQTGNENIVYPIVINLTDKNTQLKPGFSADLAITTNTRKKVLNIPQEASIEANKKTKVYLVNKGKVKIRTVSTGLRTDTRIEILKGLQLNDSIILNPDPAILKEGSLVKMQ